MTKEKGTARKVRAALTAAVLCCALVGLAVAGCSPQAGNGSPSDSPSASQAAADERTDRAQEGTFQVESGAGFLPDTDYNRTFIGAADRGCNSCHDDFYALIKNYPGHLQHIQFTDAGYGKTFTINDCMPCHICQGYGGGIYFGETLHAAHRNNPKFEEMGGDCWSCHAMKSDGTIVLWDQYKYDAELGGMPESTRDDMAAFAALRGHEGKTWAGVTVLDSMDISNIKFDQRMSDEKDIFEAVNAEIPTDLTAENYVLEVTGGVKNPRSFTMDELKALGSTTQGATDACQGSPINGVQIANREWEGVFISKIIDACGGLEEGINGAMTYAADGLAMGRTKGIQYLIDADAMIAWACNGEELGPEEGYPARLVYPGQGGAVWTKYVNRIDFFEGDVDSFTFDNFVNVWENEEAAGKGKTIYNYPNGGFNGGWFSPVDDKQVYKLGEPVPLEGYVWNFVSRDRQHFTDGIAFTADYGKTWTTFDIPDDFDPDQWAYFTAEWMPPEAGTYVLGVKPVDVMGWDTDYWASVIVQIEE